MGASLGAFAQEVGCLGLDYLPSAQQVSLSCESTSRAILSGHSRAARVADFDEAGDPARAEISAVDYLS